MMNSETTIKNFQALLNSHKLCVAACTTCNTLMLPPRLLCTNCNSKGTLWKKVSGKGKLKSFTVIHIAGTSYADDVPYVVAIVELDEGPSICARLVGVDPLKPEDIHLGDAVIADFADLSGATPEDTRTRLIFRPA